MMTNHSNKALVLISGVPGSGKTTLAHYLRNIQDESWSISADSFMVNEKREYEYDRDRLEECHSRCLEYVRSILFHNEDRGQSRDPDETGTVVVHNTFVKQWELDPYLKLAEEAGWPVFVVEMRQRFPNVHGVPDDVVDRMSRTFERSV